MKMMMMMMMLMITGYQYQDLYLYLYPVVSKSDVLSTIVNWRWQGGTLEGGGKVSR